MVVNLLKQIRTNRVSKAFVILLAACLAVTISELVRRQIVFGNYKDPPPIFLSSIVFQYVAFSFVALLFPFSYNLAKERLLRLFSVLLIAIVFVVLYLFGSAYFEWIESNVEYSLWNGFKFTLLHSSLYTLAIYGIISLILFVTGTVNIKKTGTGYLKTLTIKDRRKTILLAIDEVSLFEADGNYVTAYTGKHEKHLIRRTIKNLEEVLDPEIFVRVHRKFIINIDQVQSFASNPNGGYQLTTHSGKEVKMSKGYSSKLIKIKNRLLHHK